MGVVILVAIDANSSQFQFQLLLGPLQSGLPVCVLVVSCGGLGFFFSQLVGHGVGVDLLVWIVH